MQNVNSNPQQSPPTSHHLETHRLLYLWIVKLTPVQSRTETVIRSKLSRAKLKRGNRKQHDEQKLKINADFQADLPNKEKSFKRKKKELAQQLKELRKSQHTFTAEYKMEHLMRRRDAHSVTLKGIF